MKINEKKKQHRVKYSTIFVLNRRQQAINYGKGKMSLSDCFNDFIQGINYFDFLY